MSSVFIYFFDKPVDRSASNQNRSRNGFTLLEILLAIAIFAIVATTLLATYNRVFLQTAIADSRAKTDQAGQIAMMRMSTDLRQLVITPMALYDSKPDIPESADPHPFVATQISMGPTSFSQLRFSSLAHVSFGRTPQAGIAQIVYYLQPIDTGGYNLHRADRLFADQPFEPTPEDPILCRYVTAFDLTLHDQGETFETWNSDNAGTDYATPQAIEIHLSIGSAEQPLKTILTLETGIALPMFRPTAKQI